MPKVLKILEPGGTLDPGIAEQPHVYSVELTIDGSEISMVLETNLPYLQKTEMDKRVISVINNRAFTRTNIFHVIYTILLTLQKNPDLSRLLLTVGDAPLFDDDTRRLKTFKSLWIKWLRESQLFNEQKLYQSISTPGGILTTKPEDLLSPQPKVIRQLMENFLSPLDLIRYSATTKANRKLLANKLEKLRLALNIKNGEMKYIQGGFSSHALLFFERNADIKKYKKRNNKIKELEINLQKNFAIHPKFLPHADAFSNFNNNILRFCIIDLCKVSESRIGLIRIVEELAAHFSSNEKNQKVVEICTSELKNSLIEINQQFGNKQDYSADEIDEAILSTALKHIATRLKGTEEIPLNTNDILEIKTLTAILRSKFLNIARKSSYIDRGYKWLLSGLQDKVAKNLLLNGMTNLKSIVKDFNTILAILYFKKLCTDPQFDDLIIKERRTSQEQEIVKQVFYQPISHFNYILAWLEINTTKRYRYAINNDLISVPDVATLILNTSTGNQTILILRTLLSKPGLRLMRDQRISLADVCQIVDDQKAEYKRESKNANGEIISISYAVNIGLLLANLQEVISTKRGQLALRKDILTFQHIMEFSSPNYEGDKEGETKVLKYWLEYQFKPYGDKNQPLNLDEAIFLHDLATLKDTRIIQLIRYHFKMGNITKVFLFIAFSLMAVITEIFNVAFKLIDPLVAICKDNRRNIIFRLIVGFLAIVETAIISILSYDVFGMPFVFAALISLALAIPTVILECVVKGMINLYQYFNNASKVAEHQQWLETDTEEVIDENTALLAESKRALPPVISKPVSNDEQKSAKWSLADITLVSHKKPAPRFFDPAILTQVAAQPANVNAQSSVAVSTSLSQANSEEIVPPTPQLQLTCG